MKDYRIKLTIRNNRLLSAIEGMGNPSVKSFCKKYNLPYTSTNLIVSGKTPPLDDKGNLKKGCKNLLNILGMDIEEAFTERQMKGFSKTTFETKVEEKQLLQLVNPAKNQEVKAIESDVSSKIGEILSTLTPREERVLRMRYGINSDNYCHTYDEIGLELMISKERVRQIEFKGLEKFRKTKNISDLLNTGFYETFTSVNVKPKQIKEAESFKELEYKIKKQKVDYRNQMSKEMHKHYDTLCNLVNERLKNLSNYKKEQIHEWIRKSINEADEIKARYYLQFNTKFNTYHSTWMYDQIIQIVNDLRDVKGPLYKRAQRVMSKLRTRKCIFLIPKSRKHILYNSDNNYFIYYKQ